MTWILFMYVSIGGVIPFKTLHTPMPTYAKCQQLGQAAKLEFEKSGPLRVRYFCRPSWQKKKDP